MRRPAECSDYFLTGPLVLPPARGYTRLFGLRRMHSIDSRRVVVAAILACLALAPVASGRERGEDELRRDMEFARQQVYPALVNISVLAKGYARRARRSASPAPAAASS